MVFHSLKAEVNNYRCMFLNVVSTLRWGRGGGAFIFISNQQKKRFVIGKHLNHTLSFDKCKNVEFFLKPILKARYCN